MVPSACAARLRFDHVGVLMPFLRAKAAAARGGTACTPAWPDGSGTWSRASPTAKRRRIGAAHRFRSAGECRAQALRVPRPPFLPALFVPRFVPVLAAVLAEAFVPRLLATLFEAPRFEAAAPVPRFDP